MGAGFRVEAAEASGLTGQKGGQVEVEVVDGGFDHGAALGHGFAVEKIPFLEERGAIDDDIGLGDESGGVVLGDVGGFRNDLEPGIEGLESADGTFDPGLAEVVVGHQQLAVEVAGTEVSAMGDDQAADSGGGKFEGDDTAEAADTGHEDRGALEPALAEFTDAVDGKLPVVGGAFLVGEWG